MVKIIYQWRPIRGFFTGKAHRLTIDGGELCGETYVDSTALEFLQSLKRCGSMGMELAWDIWFKENYWYTGDNVKKFNQRGFDFHRKDDAMMFKMAFQGHPTLGHIVFIKEKVN